MPKNTKKTKSPKSNAKLRSALQAIQQAIAAGQGDLRTRTAAMQETMTGAGIAFVWLNVRYAGRDPGGKGWVFVTYEGGSNFSYSIWPEWAYGVAEGALHFNKQVLVAIPADQLAAGNNLTLALCSDVAP